MIIKISFFYIHVIPYLKRWEILISFWLLSVGLIFLYKNLLFAKLFILWSGFANKRSHTSGLSLKSQRQLWDISSSLVHKKNFSLIWQVIFKLGYVFCQERKDTSFEFEWTRREVPSYNNSRYICKQAIIKLSLAYSFRTKFFIGQNLKHVHMTYSFLELLIFFWLTLHI